MSYLETVTDILLKLNSTATKALISSGALDYSKKNRTEMLFEYEMLSSLTPKELEKATALLKNNVKVSLKNLLIQLLTEPRITKKRQDVISHLIKTIEHPPYSIVDKIEWLSDSENNLLGVAISCSKLDSYDISMTNTNCKDFKTTLLSDIILAGEVSNINTIKTKKGKNPGQEMAFVSIEDAHGLLDSVIFFPDQLETYKHHLFQGNILIFVGKKTKTKDGLVVDKCFMPKS